MSDGRVIRKKIRYQRDGIDVVGDVNAVVAINRGEPGGRASVSSSQRIVQRSRKKKARTADPADAAPDPTRRERT